MQTSFIGKAVFAVNSIGLGLLVWVSSLSAFAIPLAPTPALGPGSEMTVPYPTPDYNKGNSEQIKHGEYLAKAGDCIACHTVKGGKPFSGGLSIKTPFGTVYSQNITPDLETGIGSWSDDDFVKAMREGISPHGDYYIPVFPYPAFNKLSRQDVLDIKAYLFALPAVHQENLPLDMPWPFKIRKLQSFWRFAFFDPYNETFVPDEAKSSEWNRGAYLVQGLGHCSMCHSPLNFMGAVERQYDLAGGFVEGMRVPNISASGLKDVATETVLNVFLHDQRFNGGAIQGPMLEVNHNSLRYLKVEDLKAIVAYLRTVNSKIPPAPKLGTGEKAGENIYAKYCSGCHTMGGGGAPKLGDASQWAPILQTGMPKVYANAIKGIDGMPPKGSCDSCTDDQVKLAVDYIVKQTQGKAAAAPPKVSTAESLTSLAKGRQVYDQVCTVCHTQGLLGAPKLGDKAVWGPLLKTDMDVLIERAIDGYKGHPAKGACYQCTDADIISAVKYMAQEGGSGDYRLW